MTERRCDHCEWWVEGFDGRGLCRGAPPTGGLDGSYFPATARDDWCGAFRMSERLIFEGRREREGRIGAYLDEAPDDPGLK